MCGETETPSASSMSNVSKEDLTHQDWLLVSEQKLIQKNAPSVSTMIMGSRLVISNISEANLLNLEFLTNTDQNNNYLYLETVNVNLAGSVSPLLVSGLQDTMLDVFRLSDLTSYLAGSKTHIPFTATTFNGKSVGEFLDILTAALPTVPDSAGLTKMFTLRINCSAE